MGLKAGERQARLHYAAIRYGHATTETIRRFQAVVRFGAYTPNPDDRHVPDECPLCVTTPRSQRSRSRARVQA